MFSVNVFRAHQLPQRRSGIVEDSNLLSSRHFGDAARRPRAWAFVATLDLSQMRLTLDTS